jgi:Trypsin Inhibitor like cysteine rich domain
LLLIVEEVDYDKICGKSQEYRECGTGCEKTCTNKERKCPEKCSPELKGCYCPERNPYQLNQFQNIECVDSSVCDDFSARHG